jgi:hypothetical protein
MIFGLLTTQLLGDEVTAARWEELPEVLTTRSMAYIPERRPCANERPSSKADSTKIISGAHRIFRAGCS